MGTLRVEVLREAEDDASAAFNWYAERSANAGDGFLSALDRAVNQIRENPMQFPALSHRTRRALLRRFPYMIVYRIGAEAIQIIAVAHTSREPGFWNKRLK